MIVIACYNNIEIINTMLSSLVNTTNLDEDILIICTDYEQISMVEHLKNLNKYSNYFNLITDVTPYKGYDTGAFIWAYKNYKSDYYIFLQESLVVNKNNWFEVFKSYRDSETLNTWCTFTMGWDNEEQKINILSKINDNNYDLIGHPLGVFGNMFQISYESLKKIDKKYDLENFIPTSKVLGSCGMERGWSYLAVNCGLKINNVDGFFSSNENDYIDKLFLKKFHNRY